MTEGVIRYGGIYNHSLVNTTDATPTVIGTVVIDDSYTGWVKINVSAILTDGTEVNAGEYRVKFFKIGTLTVGTVATIWEDFDSVITVTVSADVDENLSIVGTGVAATNINWIARTQLIDQIFTDLP